MLRLLNISSNSESMENIHTLILSERLFPDTKLVFRLWFLVGSLMRIFSTSSRTSSSSGTYTLLAIGLRISSTIKLLKLISCYLFFFFVETTSFSQPAFFLSVYKLIPPLQRGYSFSGTAVSLSLFYKPHYSHFL